MFSSSGYSFIDLPNWLLRVALFITVWWILTDGAVDSWLVGAPVVLFATLVSVLMLPATSWSLIGIVRFIPFFVWQSIRGGIDVASRAMHPRLPIAPGLFDYRFRLPPGSSRIFMSNVVNLLPGTLSVELDEDNLHVHVLDVSGTFSAEFKALENRIADIFVIELTNELAATSSVEPES